MDLLNSIYDWGASLMKGFYGSPTVGLTACTSSQNYEPIPRDQGAADPITLEQPEVDAIMAMNPGRGNSCNMHNLYQGPNTDFWNDTAQYIIESKFSNRVRNEDTLGIRDALAELAPNQRQEVINLLAAELRNQGDPLSVVGEREYSVSCARGLFAFPQAFPTMRLNVSYTQLLGMIDTARTTVQAEFACEPRLNVDLPHLFAISEFSPDSGAQGSKVTLTLSGEAINFFGENNALPEGLTLDLGAGITVGEITRTEEGNLQTTINISATAARSEREVILRVADQELAAQIGCYNFTVTQGQVSRPEPAPAPVPVTRPEPTPRPAPRPVTKPVPQPAQPSGLSFGSKKGI
jgi:hypothetical protein